MKLTVEQKRQLRDTLMSAFPDKNKLEQIVSSCLCPLSRSAALKKENLEKRLANLEKDYNSANTQIDATNNAVDRNRLENQAKDLLKQIENIERDINQIYENILTEIIEKTAESKEWIEKLIDKASKENPGNQKLKEFRKQYDSISKLFNILTPLEKNFIHEMTQAYRACRNNGYEDWEGSVDTVEQILTNLVEMPEVKGSHSPIVKFVLIFLENSTIPDRTAEDLQEWLKPYINIPDPSNLTSNNLNLVENQSIPTYLIFSLQASLQKKNFYNLMAYFIPYGDNGKFNCSTGEGCQLLELTNKSAISLKKICALLEEYIELSKNYMKDYFAQPMLLFFLPRNLLLKEPVDCWKYNKTRTIGSAFHVILRCNQRLKNSYLNKNDWIRKWQKIHSKEAINFISRDCDKLNKELNKPGSVGLKSMQILSEKHLDTLDATATPVAIWLRQLPNNIDCQGEIDKLVNSEITELPSLVKDKRMEALDISNEDSHIGCHLSLLWEDPHLFPPPIEYTIPS